MKLTEKQKKLLWIAVAVFAVIHFFPRAAYLARQAVQAHQQGPQKPPAGHPAGPSPSLIPPGSPIAEFDPQFVKFRGDWMGTGMIPNRGICRMGFELRLNQEPDKHNWFLGYSRLSCGPSLPFNGKPMNQQSHTESVLNQLTPVNTILDGQPKDGSVHFAVREQIGQPVGENCPITGMTITPFGEQIAIAWQQSGGCLGGNLLMQRVQRAQGS